MAIDSQTFERITSKLVHNGFSSIKRGEGYQNTIEIDGARVRVAVAPRDARDRWRVSLHQRDQRMHEDEIDAYLIALDDVPGYRSHWVYLIFIAPIGKTGMRFSVPSLMDKYHQYRDNWDALRRVIALKKRRASKLA